MLEWDGKWRRTRGLKSLKVVQKVERVWMDGRGSLRDLDECGWIFIEIIESIET